MLQYSYTVADGFVVSLADLRVRLAVISNGDHQWVALPITKQFFIDGAWRSYIMIGYTNPSLGSLPNHLCFLFPIIVEPEDRADDAKRFICLHGSVAIVLSHGLYYEGDKVKEDVLEDWLAFWTPLAESLSALSPFDSV